MASGARATVGAQALEEGVVIFLDGTRFVKGGDEAGGIEEGEEVGED